MENNFEIEEMKDMAKQMLFSGMTLEDNTLNFYIINPEDTTKGLKLSLHNSMKMNDDYINKYFERENIDAFLKSSNGQDVDRALNAISRVVASCYIESSNRLLYDNWLDTNECPLAKVAEVNGKNKDIYNSFDLSQMGNNEIIHSFLQKQFKMNRETVYVKGKTFEDMEFFDSKNNQLFLDAQDRSNILKGIVLYPATYGTKNIVFEERQVNTLLHDKSSSWNISNVLKEVNSICRDNEKRFFLNDKAFTFKDFVGEMKKIEDKTKVKFSSLEEMKTKLLSLQKNNDRERGSR